MRRRNSKGFAPILGILLIVALFAGAVFLTYKFQSTSKLDTITQNASALTAIQASIGQLAIGQYNIKVKPACKIKGETVTNFKSTLATSTKTLATLKAALAPETAKMKKLNTDYASVKPVEVSLGIGVAYGNSALKAAAITANANLDAAQSKYNAASTTAQKAKLTPALTAAKTAFTKAQSALDAAQKKYDNFSDYQKTLRTTAIPAEQQVIDNLNAQIASVNSDIKALNATIAGFASLKECQTSETSCTDGIDNNRDGLVDCQDKVCHDTNTICKGMLGWTPTYDPSQYAVTIVQPKQIPTVSSGGDDDGSYSENDFVTCATQSQYVLLDTSCSITARATQDNAGNINGWVSAYGTPLQTVDGRPADQNGNLMPGNLNGINNRTGQPGPTMHSVTQTNTTVDMPSDTSGPPEGSCTESAEDPETDGNLTISGGLPLIGSFGPCNTDGQCNTGKGWSQDGDSFPVELQPGKYTTAVKCKKFVRKVQICKENGVTSGKIVVSTQTETCYATNLGGQH